MDDAANEESSDADYADGAGIDRHEMDRVAAIVSLVDASDVERVDPPAGLWGRIAAAVAAEPDRVAVGAGTVVEYAIDADDVVVPAGEEVVQVRPPERRARAGRAGPRPHALELLRQ